MLEDTEEADLECSSKPGLKEGLATLVDLNDTVLAHIVTIINMAHLCSDWASGLWGGDAKVVPWWEGR